MKSRMKSWVINLKFRILVWVKNPDEPNKQKIWVLWVHKPTKTQYLAYEEKDRLST